MPVKFKYISWKSSDVDCISYRLMRDEQERLEEALITAPPGRRHFLRIDLQNVRRAIEVIKERNMKEAA